jgi:hypothetical protein
MLIVNTSRRNHEQNQADAGECPGSERLDAEEKRVRTAISRGRSGTPYDGPPNGCR